MTTNGQAKTPWTPEPWRIYDRYQDSFGVLGIDGYEIVECSQPHLHEHHDGKHHWNYEDGSARDIKPEEEGANAARIVACVNAMVGIADPQPYVEAIDALLAAASDAFTGIDLSRLSWKQREMLVTLDRRASAVRAAREGRVS